MSNIINFSDNPGSNRKPKRKAAAKGQPRQATEREKSGARKAAAGKDVTWLAQFDAFKEPPFDGEESPAYYAHSGFDMANAMWSVRLSVNSDATRKEAHEMVLGIAAWIERMGDKEFKERVTPRDPIEPMNVSDKDLPF